ncbi:hypothetical protein M9458_024225, partial [Cirrhinus mrigala]
SAARGAAASSSSFVRLGPRHFQGIKRPGILARSHFTGAVHVRTVGPAAHHFGSARPSTHPSWTHEDTSVHARGTDRSPEERRARHFNSGGDDTSGVPHHTPPDLAVSAPLLSHTPTPVGSLVKCADYCRGDYDN